MIFDLFLDKGNKKGSKPNINLSTEGSVESVKNSGRARYVESPADESYGTFTADGDTAPTYES